MSYFSKISLNQWCKDWKQYVQPNMSLEEPSQECIKAYDNIKLPYRSSIGSAGYDFTLPYDVIVNYPTCSYVGPMMILTGVRWITNSRFDLKLELHLRSSMAKKYQLKLADTVAIIDSDYYLSDNEGHIFIQMDSDSSKGLKPIVTGERIIQGIISRFELTDDDGYTVSRKPRNGGIGSTGK